MKITMVMVQTLNGRITRGDDPHPSKWASKEDQKHFLTVLHENKVLIQGSATFEATPATTMPQDGKLRVVLTRNPGKYAKFAKPDKYEFTSSPPKTIVADLEKRGYTDALLIGGGKINALFLKEGLVTHLSLTVEPKIFGEGKLVVDQLKDLDVNLKLINCDVMNQRGSLLLTYEVLQ